MTFYTVGEGFNFDVGGRSDINDVMREWEDRYSTYRTASIFVTTFNVNGRSAPMESVSEWLELSGQLADIYVVGLQEVDMMPQAFIMNLSTRHVDWQNAIKKSLPSSFRYILLQEIRLVGIYMAVYRRIDSKFKMEMDKIETEFRATGFSLIGKMGNKGGVAVSLSLNDTAICFVNSHMAAGTEEWEKRNQDYREISQIRFPKSCKTLFDHDAVIWLGDMNYRLQPNNGLMNDEIRQLCYNKDSFHKMLVYDQLKIQQKMNRTFIDFKEPDVLTFRPTYKYDPGTNIWDTSEKARCPAWCDRILWWSRDGVDVKQQFYESVESVTLSDHKPVRSLFHVQVREIDQQKYNMCYEDAIREADHRANEALPQIAVSATDVDFGDVYFFQSALRTITVTNTCKTNVTFAFTAEPSNEDSAWLSVTPPCRTIKPGTTCTISLQVLVDKNTAWSLDGNTYLSQILVLRLHQGRHYFITIYARYQPSVFGASFVDLLKKEAQLSSDATHLIDLSLTSDSTPTNVLLGIPNALYRLCESLRRCGLENVCFTDAFAHSEFIAIRKALDDSTDLSIIRTSPFCMYDTLLTLISAFKEVIIPSYLHEKCMLASDDEAQCWSCVEDFPVEHRNVFIYLIGFVRQLLAKNESALSQMQLLADLLFRKVPGDANSLQRLGFLEMIVAFDREHTLKKSDQDASDLIIL